MGSRKAPARDETIASEPRSDGSAGSKPAGIPTIEERRERILASIEKLDEDGILRVDWFVRAILEDDPVLMSMASAPEDDEPETEEERIAVEEAMKDVEAGRLIPHEEVKRLWLGEDA